MSSGDESKTAAGSRPVKLPQPGKRNLLITSALPYVNNVPHLGNIIGCVLSGDVYARYTRLRGYNSIYICGTDEYGTATETKAQQEGLTPREICDKYNAIHRQVYEWFDISFDHFGRTSTSLQTKIAQDIFWQCYNNGYVISKDMEQQYCAGCDRYLADRFVAGTCYLCGYTDAKGDQCDKCGKLLNAIKLVNPKCILCKQTPEVRVSSHLFLDLPKLQERLDAFVESRKDNWSAPSYSQTRAWLKTGLEPRCITRDLKWGTPVPLEGYTDKVFYVWFDAPIGYISITADYTPEGWERWWKAEKYNEGKNENEKVDVELVQFMGKDNVPFHTVIFPCTLLAANDGYTMLRTLPTTEYLNYEGTKFSKTRGTGVFGDTAMETGIPSEVWRYYLLSNRPETTDTMFTWDDFLSKSNDLNNNLGNLIQRVLSFIAKNFNGEVPPTAGGSAAFTQYEHDLENEVNELLLRYVKAMEAQSIKEALRVAMDIAFSGNKYLQRTQPWALLKTDVAACGRTLSIAVQVAKLLAIVLEPFMPAFSRGAFAQLGIALEGSPLADEEFNLDLAKMCAALDFASTTTPEVAEAKAETEATKEKLPKVWDLTAFADANSGEGSSKQVGVGAKLWVPANTKIGTPKPLFEKIELAKIEALRKRFAGHAQQQEAKGDGPAFPIDVRVGQIGSVARHPTNPKLLVMNVHFTEGAARNEPTGTTEFKETRQIVAGLVDTYGNPADDGSHVLANRKVLCLCNLKPGKFGGVLSEGMLLTAIEITPEGQKAFLLDPGVDTPLNAFAVPEGCPRELVKVFDVKSKFASLQMTLGEDKTVLAGGRKLLVNGNPVVSHEASPGARIQ